jgi:hypothetical protein
MASARSRLTEAMLRPSRCSRYLVQKADEAATLPYIPPVTPDTLPAEEMLVRGSEEPQAGSETLVRPSTATRETPAEQLLRSTNTG